ncbi:acyltransferase family protein [Furfurilactobacillus siliginis]|uniref:Acyltransferase n=1 Tax=Furfurilactobacillus siliginis TaxID=348151 RepID=A0A0R2L9H5_9LACO|nr:acyltransferase family protein [Furfurilactobacillus siliginis]KRN95405.1 acyltransferase [Furfurilactobacillus siliginis]GEK28185.1 acyltransferase [Furfurilactobacillus siliginis]
MQAASTSAPRRYITGIDGLRTFAVLGVILYHLLPAALPGGFLGVPIFLGLTGYLVTDSFLNQLGKNQPLALRQFYGRRLKRLYPALVTMLVVTSAYITLFARQLLGGLRAVILTNLTYVYNWFEIGHGQSYFDRFNGESPFTHLWTLSIEGQFYLLWPVIIWLLVRFLKKRSRIAGVLLGLAVVSAVMMGVLYHGDDSINRVYYGTDTRAFSLLLGASLAAVWPSRHLNPTLQPEGRRLLNIVGSVSMIVMFAMYWWLSGTDAGTYRGGMFIFAIFATLMIAVIVHPGASWNKWLSNPVFSWIGKRSYGIYLYQFPVMVFYELKVVNVARHSFFNALVELAIILILTELSYHFVEEPLAHTNWTAVWQTLRQPRTWQTMPVRSVTGGILAVMTLATLVGFVQAPAKATAPTNSVTKHINAASKRAAARNKKIAAQKTALTASTRQEKQTNTAANKQLNDQQRKLGQQFGLQPSVTLAAQHSSLTAVGDSILVDNADNLQAVFGHAYVDAKVGRQVWDAPTVIASLKKQHLLASNVLINLGTNAPLTQPQIDAVLKAIGPKHKVFWVNTMVPTKNWQNQVNALLAVNAKQRKNMYLIDWFQLSQNQPGWFGPDHVHPNPTGSVAYTKLVVNDVVAATDK